MNYVEIVCSPCLGNGIIDIGDEWTGFVEGRCKFCRGKGTRLVHKNWAKLGFVTSHYHVYKMR